MWTFVLAKLNEPVPVGKTSVHAVLLSPYNDITTTTYALMRYLRENNIPFSVRQHRTRRGDDIVVFNFGGDDYTVRTLYGGWEYAVLHKDWFGWPEWTLPTVGQNK